MYKEVLNPRSDEIDSVLLINGNIIKQIPFNEANSDYQTYLIWLSEGNKPLPPDSVK